MMRPLLVVGWTIALACTVVALARPAPSARPLELFGGVPSRAKQQWPSIADRARHLAQHGGVLSSAPGASWGKAMPAMKRLSARLIEIWFRPAGYAAVEKALCISQREAGFNPGAISSSGDYGLPQANFAAHHDTYDFGPSRFSAHAIAAPANSRLLDPVYGVAVFWRLSDHGTDWHPWDGGRYPC